MNAKTAKELRKFAAEIHPTKRSIYVRTSTGTLRVLPETFRGTYLALKRYTAGR